MISCRFGPKLWAVGSGQQPLSRCQIWSCSTDPSPGSIDLWLPGSPESKEWVTIKRRENQNTSSPDMVVSPKGSGTTLCLFDADMAMGTLVRMPWHFEWVASVLFQLKIWIMSALHVSVQQSSQGSASVSIKPSIAVNAKEFLRGYLLAYFSMVLVMALLVLAELGCQARLFVKGAAEPRVDRFRCSWAVCSSALRHLVSLLWGMEYGSKFAWLSSKCHWSEFLRCQISL